MKTIVMIGTLVLGLLATTPNVSAGGMGTCDWEYHIDGISGHGDHCRSRPYSRYCVLSTDWEIGFGLQSHAAILCDGQDEAGNYCGNPTENDYSCGFAYYCRVQMAPFYCIGVYDNSSCYKVEPVTSDRYGYLILVSVNPLQCL